MFRERLANSSLRVSCMIIPDISSMIVEYHLVAYVSRLLYIKYLYTYTCMYIHTQTQTPL